MNLRGGRVVSATTVFTWHRRDASVTYDGQVAATVASDIKEALVCARDDASGAAEAISAYEVAKGLVRHRPMLRRQGGLPGRRIGRAAIPRLTRQPRRAAVAHHRHVATSRAADVEKLASGHDEVSRSPDAMATDKVVEVRHGSLRRHRRVGIRTIYTPSSHPRQRQPRPTGGHAAAAVTGREPCIYRPLHKRQRCAIFGSAGERRRRGIRHARRSGRNCTPTATSGNAGWCAAWQPCSNRSPPRAGRWVTSKTPNGRCDWHGSGLAERVVNARVEDRGLGARRARGEPPRLTETARRNRTCFVSSRFWDRRPGSSAAPALSNHVRCLPRLIPAGSPAM
jgi:hypothetical protein